MTTRNPRGRTAVLFAVACGVSVLLLDALFRLYESQFLIHELEAGGPHYDLTSLRYNDHVGNVTAERAPGEFRILSFGDSFAEAVTTPEYSYAAVLERTLQSAVPEPRIRVVNFGRSKTSFPDYISQYRIWSQRLEFDAVLFNIYAGNDFHEVDGSLIAPDEQAGLRAPAGEDTLQYGPGLEIPHHYPLRFLDHLYAQLATRLYAAEVPSQYQKLATHIPKAAYPRRISKHVEVYRPADFSRFGAALFWIEKLARLARKIESTGARVAILVSPPHFLVSPELNRRVLKQARTTPVELNLELPAAAVRSAADRAGLSGPVIDLTPCLRAIGADGTELYFGTNTHWNVRGNERVGHLLAASLAERWFSRTSDSTRTLGCDLIAPPPSAEVATLLESTLETVRALSRFEIDVLARLEAQVFSSRAELRVTLANLGFHEDPSAIRGEFWGFLKDAHGWALDTAAIGEPVVVVLFHQGRVVSAVRTRESSVRVARKFGLTGAGRAPLMYRTNLRGTLRISRGGDLWAIAISPAGRFGMLAAESDQPH